MNKLNSVIQLINSLNQGEKRYFKLQSGLQQGAKDYVDLFENIQSGAELKDIKRNFLQKHPGASFDVSCNYLYKLILETMLHLRSEKDITVKLTTDMLKVNILFERGLYNDGFKLLKKTQTLAEGTEQQMMQIWASSLELNYISSLNYHSITEPDLVYKQTKLQGLLKNIQQANQHISLYQLLHHRLLHKGNVRTAQQKAELNDLVVTELSMVSKPFTYTFESQKTHLLFQAYYFITISDYKSALKTFYELDDLFEQHDHLWKTSPMDYLTALEGVLDSLHSIRKYQEMRYFIDKIKLVNTFSDYQEVTVERIIYTYTVRRFLDHGDFEGAELLSDDYQNTLFKRIGLLDVGKRAEVYLCTALIHMGSGQFDQVKTYLNLILFESKIYDKLPVFRTFRLINLLVHFELANHDYVKYEIRSIKRGLTDNNAKAYLLEKIIFKFVSTAAITTDAKERLLLWEKLKKDFTTVSSYKYELQLLRLFNFSAWIESKLCKKPFVTLLRQAQQVEII